MVTLLYLCQFCSYVFSATLSAAINTKKLKSVKKFVENSLKKKDDGSLHSATWQSDLNSGLTQALTTHQSDIVEYLLQVGAQVRQDATYYPLLYMALDLKETKSFQTLLHHTPDDIIANTLSWSSGSLIHAAVRSGSVEVVRQVVEVFKRLNLSLDEPNKAQGLTPLHIAVQCLLLKSKPIEWFSASKSLKHRRKRRQEGVTEDKENPKQNTDVYGKRNNSSLMHDISIVKFLLEQGVNVNTTDRNGRTALHEAAFLGLSELVQLLLDFGADPSIADKDNRIPWMHAVSFNRSSVLKILTDKCDLSTYQIGGRSVMHLACSSGCLNTIDMLLEQGIKLDIVSEDGLTPLMEAVKADMPHCVDYLIEKKKCDVNFVSEKNQSALSIAISNLSSVSKTTEKILESLIKAGANIDQRDHNGNTFLLTYFNNEPARKWLLDNGADVNVVGKDDITPVWLAAKRHGNVGVALTKELMEYNVDMSLVDRPNTADGLETTAFIFAIQSSNAELCTLYLNSGCRGYLVRTRFESDSGKVFLAGMSDEMKPIVKRIMTQICKPATMEDLARQSVLKSLGTKDIPSKIHCLCIPQTVKAYMKWPVFTKWKQSLYEESVAQV